MPIALVRDCRATELGGVDQCRTRGIQLRHEGAASRTGQEGPWGRREVAGRRPTRHIGVAGAVHGDAIGIACPAEPPR